MERTLLGGEVEAREDDDAVQPVRPALAGRAVRGKRRSPVGAHARLDRVEHVGDAHWVAAADDLDLDAVRRRNVAHQLGGERRELPAHQAALR